MQNDDYKKQLQDYKIELKKVYEKSQDTFEKQLSFLSAGALGFSMLFVEKIVNDFNSSKCKWTIILSWLILGGTLIVNLVSHLLSARNNYKTMSEIDNDLYSFEKVNGRIRIINFLNWTTIVMLLIGILLFIFFVLFNI